MYLEKNSKYACERIKSLTLYLRRDTFLGTTFGVLIFIFWHYKLRKFSDKSNFYTLAKPHRKAADSQEIMLIVEDLEKKEADLSGLSDDSAGVKTFQLADREGKLLLLVWRQDNNHSSISKNKWYIGFFYEILSGKLQLFSICFFNDIIHDFIKIGQVCIPHHTCCTHNVVKEHFWLKR